MSIHPLCHNDVVPPKDHNHDSHRYAITATKPQPVTAWNSLFWYPNSQELLGPQILGRLSSAAGKEEADKWISNYDSQCARAIIDRQNAVSDMQNAHARTVIDMQNAHARAVIDMKNAHANFVAKIRDKLQEDLAQMCKLCNATPLKHVYKRKKVSNKSATDQSSRGNTCIVDNQFVDHAYTSPVIGVDDRSSSEEHA